MHHQLLQPQQAAGNRQLIHHALTQHASYTLKQKPGVGPVLAVAAVSSKGNTHQLAACVFTLLQKRNKRLCQLCPVRARCQLQIVQPAKVGLGNLIGIKGFRQGAGGIRINFHQLIIAASILNKIQTADIADAACSITQNIGCKLIGHIQQVKRHFAAACAQCLHQARKRRHQRGADILQTALFLSTHQHRAQCRVTVLPLRRIHIRHYLPVNFIYPGVIFTVFCHLVLLRI